MKREMSRQMNIQKAAAIGKTKKRTLAFALLSAVLAAFLFAVICRTLQITPFYRNGQYSLASNDAYFQYLDFFAWFKDVLDGKETIAYTFNSSLGQNGVGIYAYYLASPVSLLVKFFDKSDLPNFFSIAVTIKIGLASGTMYVYLRKRFRDLGDCFAVLIALSYSLMQYNIAQSSNIMWLDGVYMLPLILLGVYNVVAGTSSILLAVTVACSIIFNWYTGGINCLAAIIWFFAELGLNDNWVNHERKVKAFIRSFIRFCFTMLCGVLMSMVLFLPAILCLRQGKGGTFDWSAFQNIFLGNVLNTIHGFSIGEVSAAGNPALFCGSVILFGLLFYFTLHSAPERKKISNAFLLFVAIMILYWKPLFMIFSLLKEAESYWYRYGYVSIAAFSFIAAQAYEAFPLADGKVLLKTGSVYLTVALILDYCVQHNNPQLFYMTLTLEAGMLLLLSFFLCSKSRMQKHVVFCFTSICLILELSANCYEVGKTARIQYGQGFADYERQQQELVSKFQSDQSSYRVTQLMTREMNYESTTANYNESMAFNYKSIENYTSCPQTSQLNLLDKLGYITYNDCLLAKNTFLQPADTILGVKYVLSPYNLKGIVQEDESQLNGKRLYQNAYYLPVALSSAALKDSQLLQPSGYKAPNTFEYWNRLYRDLSGKDADIMKPLPYERKEGTNEVDYVIDLSGGNYALYGEIHCNGEANATLNLNGKLSIPYARWQAVKAFNCPTENNEESAFIHFYADDISLITEELFYGLDLDRFEELTEILRSRGADHIELDHENVQIDITGEENEILFTSIPFDSGWKITVNGNEMEPELLEDCLICLPLSEGENHIEMHYHIPGLRAGAGLSILSAAALFVAEFNRKKRKREN